MASMEQPPLARVIAGLPPSVPFVGPETLERRTGVPFVARLGANESAFGPSPLAVAAIAAAAADGWMYGDPEAFALRTALATHHGIDRANIVCGVGIDGVLGTAVRLFVEPGTPVVTSLGGYPTFAFHVRAAGGVLHQVPYRDDREDLAALADLSHLISRERLVFSGDCGGCAGFGACVVSPMVSAPSPARTHPKTGVFLCPF
jgi:histidinol-phosphate aminotransferase